MSLNIDLAKTVEVGLDGLSKFTSSQLLSVTLCAFMLMLPWWLYRVFQLTISEMQQLRKDAIGSMEQARKDTIAAMQQSRQQIVDVIALQHKAIQAIHATHESVIAAMPDVCRTLEAASAVRESLAQSISGNESLKSTEQSVKRKPKLKSAIS